MKHQSDAAEFFVSLN